MKVAYIFGSLNRGGAETLILDVLKNCHQVKIEPICIHRKNGSLYKEFFTATNGKMIYIGPGNLGRIGYIFRLRKALKNQDIKIVHAQQPIDALYSWLASWGLDNKLVLTLHGFYKNITWWHKKILGFALKKTDANIFVSNTQLLSFLDRYPKLDSKKQHVVYNGIDLKKFQTIRGKNKKGIKVNEKNYWKLGSVGSFNPGRDQLTICKALDILSKKGINFSFVFAGGRNSRWPDLYDTCIDFCQQNNLSNNVFFTGVENNIPFFLSELDAFIYASRHDTFGIAIIEAIAMNIPTFVNDWDVINEITENGEFGNIYETQNEKDLAMKLCHFFSNTANYTLKANKDGGRVREKYNINNHLASLHDIYSTIIKV